MAGNPYDLDLVIAINGRKALTGFDSATETRVADFTLSDKVNLRVQPVRETGNGNRPNESIDISGVSLRAGLGFRGKAVSSGSFTLTFDSETTMALSYNATAADVAAALNALSSVGTDVGVSGNAGGPWTVTFGDLNDQNAISGDGTNLLPLADVSVVTQRTGTASLYEVQVIALKLAPVALATSFSSFPAAAGSVTELQAGAGANTPEIQRVSLDPAPIGGTFILTFGAASTEALPYDITAEDLQTELQDVSTIGSGNCTVTGESPTWDVTFGGLTGDQSNMSVDVSGLEVPVGLAGLLDLNTAGAFKALNDGVVTNGKVSMYLEVEMSEGGNRKTILQTPVDLLDDVLADDPSTQNSLTPLYLSDTLTGGGSKTVTISYGETISPAPTIDKIGYSFFFEGAGTDVRLTHIGTTSLTFTAKSARESGDDIQVGVEIRR